MDFFDDTELYLSFYRNFVLSLFALFTLQRIRVNGEREREQKEKETEMSIK